MKKSVFLLFWFVVFSLGLYAQDFSKAKDAKPFEMSGSLSLSGYNYSVSGIDNRQPPFGYGLGANLNFKIYGLNIPFSASINERNSSFSHPFNRFGISPQYKWAKAHIGWRNMNFSEFTLNNASFLGGGIELTPGIFRFSFMYGKLRQSAELYSIGFSQPQFDRRAMALKIGIGNTDNYFDIVAFKAKDDTLKYDFHDSLKNRAMANENLALGFQNKLSFLNKKLVFESDAALSAFTQNIRYSNLEFNPKNEWNWLKNVYTPNVSSSLNYAGDASLAYKEKYFSIATKYRRVMPEFQSLGSNYILSDLEAITVNPSFRILKNKITVSGSYGIQSNNLDGKRAATNTRNISSINLNINPLPSLGLTLGYSNYTFQQQVILDSFYNDSMVINQLNQNFTVMPRITFVKEKVIHNIILNTNYQVLSNNGGVSSQLGSNDMLLAALMYASIFKESGLGLNLGYNYFNFSSNYANIQRNSLSVGASSEFLKKKLNISVNVQGSKQKTNKISENILNLNISGKYKVLEKTSIGLTFYLTDNNSKVSGFTETRTSIRINQSF